MYDSNTFTFGSELNLGDAPKSLVIPEHLGSWDNDEMYVVNLLEPYRGMASDPLGIDPPVGGEINTTPDTSPENHAKKIGDILDLFEHPTSSFMGAHHVHVRVPGLIDDIEALKRLVRYIRDNQEDLKALVRSFDETPEMKEDGSLRYLRHEGGRMMPQWMIDNILDNSTDFESFLTYQGRGKDGVRPFRPARWMINIFCLKYIETVEFRCFRATTDLQHFYDHTRFARDFMEAALNEGMSVRELVETNDYSFAPMSEYDSSLYLSWKETKWSDKRCKTKVRRLLGVEV